MRQANRREWMRGAATMAMVGAVPAKAMAAGAILPDKAEPFPLSAVRLRPSIYATAVETNRRYLYRLDPDRLLHNFRLYAGLKPKAPIYGGWEFARYSDVLGPSETQILESKFEGMDTLE